MWKPGWNYIGDEATVEQINAVATTHEWIIEGYISKMARTSLFEKATAIIYLDYAPHISSWRYIKRWWKHRHAPRPELEGSPESFKFSFLKLVWTKGEAHSLNAALSKVSNQSKIYTLRSPREAARFLAQVLLVR